jgi:HK97 family phage prohead protease
MSDHTSPPRENLIRAVMPGVEFRDAGDDGEELPDGVLGILRVLFSPVGEWTEINSAYEGHFLERFASGSWRKTIRESAAKVRSLFQHGMDPQVGDKPLGPIRTLLEDDERGGGYGEVDLIDTSYNRDLLPGLKAGLYGASHRFAAMRETWDDNPEPSEHNPKGLPERTIKEARLMEFGPVTFGAYAGATAGVRSLTDDFLISAIRADPGKAREMFERALSLDEIAPKQGQQDQEQDQQEDAPSRTDAAPARTSDTERRVTANGNGPLALPTRTEQAGLTLTTERKANQWPIP